MSEREARGGLLYSFYGDDFTGSTDVLERLASAGVESVLFLQPPTAEQMARFAAVRAVGMAGDARSRGPEWMSAELPRVFGALRELGAPVVQYKVCSTFDSSPTHGSIGRAMELGVEAMSAEWVPIIVGAPHLRRYVYEEELFAAGPDDAVHRIDRHPMRWHPVTPMREANLRKHLRAQSAMPVGHLRASELTSAGLEAELRRGCKAVLLDTFDGPSLKAAGELVWGAARRRQVFGVGSSGFTAALIEAWRGEGLLERGHVAAKAGPAGGPLLVVSGSCSALTEGQIRSSLAHGWEGVALEPGELLESKDAERAAVERACSLLGAGRDVVLYTALGTPAGATQGDALGVALGRMTRAVLERTSITRVLVCGGDTSSHAVQQLGVEALTWAADLQKGVPLCRAHGATWRERGLELVLKGGQMGTEDFFAVVRDGVS